MTNIIRYTSQLTMPAMMTDSASAVAAAPMAASKGELSELHHNDPVVMLFSLKLVKFHVIHIIFLTAMHDLLYATYKVVPCCKKCCLHATCMSSVTCIMICSMPSRLSRPRLSNDSAFC